MVRIVSPILLTVFVGTTAAVPASPRTPRQFTRSDDIAIGREGQLDTVVPPATLADLIGELAGRHVMVPRARVVGVFDSRAFLIESESSLSAPLGNRDRVIVLVSTGTLRVPSAAIVASTVTVTGVARTVLGAQVSSEVPWPAKLKPNAVTRLEIRAAIVATSVRTAEGVELTKSLTDPTASR
jgi:hypothetical protein